MTAMTSLAHMAMSSRGLVPPTHSANLASRGPDAEPLASRFDGQLRTSRAQDSSSNAVRDQPHGTCELTSLGRFTYAPSEKAVPLNNSPATPVRAARDVGPVRQTAENLTRAHTRARATSR
ncbi:hypothetical protein C8Q70DRAFT_66051 [Cubamyces menziesii]|nr:hypothetical protein C8Q70DRAFT_65794 [Cubamyces menziesii]KAI0660650.1 hypothetical protein C8Q70DRAFT_66051 [Cubamyces menziesii]